MANSLQDQLMKAGLVNEKQVKKAKHTKRKQQKQQRKSGAEIVDEGKRQAQQALADKADKARELNLQREQEAEKKAIVAQIRQLIELNKLDRAKGDTAYNFADHKKIKKLYVEALQLEQLSKGRLAVVKLDDRYEIVPAVVADKIAQRDDQFVIVRNEIASSQDSDTDEEDPYADYQIPDDLMW